MDLVFVPPGFLCNSRTRTVPACFPRVGRSGRAAPPRSMSAGVDPGVSAPESDLCVSGFWCIWVSCCSSEGTEGWTFRWVRFLRPNWFFPQLPVFEGRRVTSASSCWTHPGLSIEERPEPSSRRCCFCPSGPFIVLGLANIMSATPAALCSALMSGNRRLFPDSSGTFSFLWLHYSNGALVSLLAEPLFCWTILVLIGCQR